MESIHGFDFFRLNFDGAGAPAAGSEFEELNDWVGSSRTTDVIFMAHGFRNDEGEATRLYSNFLESFARNQMLPEMAASFANRKFAVAGVYWPSKAFKESFDSGTAQAVGNDGAEKEAARAELLELTEIVSDAPHRQSLTRALGMLDSVRGNSRTQDDLVDNLLSVLDGVELEPMEGIEGIKAKTGSELLEILKYPLILPITRKPRTNEGRSLGVPGIVTGGTGRAQSVTSSFGSIFGRIGQLLNVTTWYLMKHRSGVVGEKGLASAVREIRRTHGEPGIHLVGHSLGGRLMAGCARSLADPLLRIDSLTLLEAAFSHYGFSPENGERPNGYFRSVVEKKVTRGPFLVTYSAMDTVVGKVYAIASRLAGDNVRALGDEKDPFGGIGRNGPQDTPEGTSHELHEAGVPYVFASDVIIGLDGSDNLIKHHGDVTNDAVTYAFASAVKTIPIHP